MKFCKHLLLLAFLLGSVVVSSGQAAVEVVATVPVDQVWAGHPVGFALLTHAPLQFVAYYNGDRELVVASRKLDESAWKRISLPERVVWDSHNYLTLALDDQEHLHLSGNLHVNPLVYFKTESPMDITSFVRLDRLVGTEESRMTYPRFFRGPAGEFIFTYRDGSSGSGNQIYNVYDASDQSWARLLDSPLTDGEGKMNAYMDGPRLGPDGFYHSVWVWRDTPDCATNHHVSYMRSRDLRHWENVRGEALSLPVTLQSPGTVVDPVSPGGGLINGNAKLGFDGEKRPVLTYHKYDADGNSQVYNARWADGSWAISQATNWTSRWQFQGGGSIAFKVRVQPVKADGDGGLIQEWSHWELGRERWQLDLESLRATKKLPLPPSTSPPGFHRLESDFSGLTVRSASDSGKSPDPRIRYMLRWETLGPNRDRPRTPPLPPPSALTLYEIRR
ncbi:MAG: BNR repeat-containing protein [Candidatus Hydrogenedentes bacterium]|nr:BNR repeat-containing protein [Candidatus Hydrogenedentota bacterium]